MRHLTLKHGSKKSQNFRVKILFVREIKLSADQLVSALLRLSKGAEVCFLDSCGISYLDSHLLIAGVNPVEILQLTNEYPNETLKIFNEKISCNNSAAIFSISYDFGLKLENIKPRKKDFFSFNEPDVFLALFDCLIIHDYSQNKTFLSGDEKAYYEIEKLLTTNFSNSFDLIYSEKSKISSNFTRRQYLSAVKEIQKYILRGDTYQTNLTQQFRAELPLNLTAQKIFWRLRKTHPAPFAAFLKRKEDFVVSISPERFFRVQGSSISTSPIKGTRRRGENKFEDARLRRELIESEKDRAENVMIVDLLRNDLGKICEFGSVKVEKLCDLESHPTLFHLVSTVKGELLKNTSFSEIIQAVFPCGSITGAPKIRTMQIINELETANRGLSMGAIGYSIPDSNFQIPNSKTLNTFDLNVSIRTMTIRESEAIFNVGGGIVFDSLPENEYEETLVKAKALMNVINAELDF